MSEVWWPPNERVMYLGFLSTPDVAWVATAVAVAVTGIVAGRPFTFGAVALLIATMGRAQIGGVRVRTRVARRLAWWRRRDRAWSSPIAASDAKPAPMLRDVRLAMLIDDGRPVCVVEQTTPGLWRGGKRYTVMMEVSCASVTFLADAERAQRFSRWGDVLGSQCVERGEQLAAERVMWLDVHRAANPHALRREHAVHGRPGPATDDYLAHVTGFGEVAADHTVVVAVTVSRAQLAVARSKAGLTGSPDDVLRQAVVSVARGIRAQLAANGFDAGDLYRPADVGRLFVDVGDPFARRGDALTARERFGLPERCGPESVEVRRRELAVDGAYHRVFQVRWPRTAVRPEWMWRLLAVEGPKVVATVFEPLAPSRADRERDGTANRQRANSVIVAKRRGGEESVQDSRKRAALRAIEAAVAGGHEELDCWSMVMVSGRTPGELDARTERVREALRESGKASLRELTGMHDAGFRLVLPLGAPAPAARE